MALTLSSPVAFLIVSSAKSMPSRRNRPVLFRMAFVGIDPGDHENRVALVDAPFDEALLRIEIEHIEFVDPGRADEERALQHFLRRRLILDDLADIVLGNDLAGG